uniref:ARAD1D49610p n=1 Tax=Blastobotrys adeninivorans TaxID=409370 RepID=A0A060TDB6_BLAAD
MVRHSGLQKDVLNLYRRCIRAVHKKPAENQRGFLLFVRQSFHQYESLPRKDFGTIEHLLRKGNKMLELYSNPNVRKIS